MMILLPKGRIPRHELLVDIIPQIRSTFWRTLCASSKLQGFTRRRSGSRWQSADMRIAFPQSHSPCVAVGHPQMHFEMVACSLEHFTQARSLTKVLQLYSCI